MLTLLIHLRDGEPFKLDVEDLPKPEDQALYGKNPRTRDNKDANWIEDGVTTVMVPWWRITVVEILPDPDAQAEFPLPFRED